MCSNKPDGEIVNSESQGSRFHKTRVRPIFAHSDRTVMFRAIAALALTGAVLTHRIPDNPCGNVFTYMVTSGGFYSGEAVVPYDGSKTLNFAINASMVGLYQHLVNNFRLTLSTPLENLPTGSPLRYRVDFPVQNVLPKITQIVYNGRVYCYGPPEPLGPNGVTSMWKSLHHVITTYTFPVPNGISTDNSSPGANRPTDLEPEVVPFPADNRPNPEPEQVKPTTPTQTAFTSSIFAPPSSTAFPVRTPGRDVCGVTNDIQTLVVNGQRTGKDEYPWLVAMYWRKGVSYQFQCTANLISDRHAVTAAHCVQLYKALFVTEEDLLFILGRSNLTNWALAGADLRTASKITVHPDYKQYTGHCDVAVIELSQPVTFTPTLRPICLWQGDVDLDKVVNTDGVVAGWGTDGRETVAEPRKVTMPVVSQEDCLRSNPAFRNLTSDMTFCAGNRNGSGPCSGDSGAGFILKQNGRWFLRGVVSTAIKQTTGPSCNLEEYLIFSDIAKLGNWIKSSMK